MRYDWNIRVKYKSNQQKSALYHTETLYKARNTVNNFLMIIPQWYLSLYIKQFMEK